MQKGEILLVEDNPDDVALTLRAFKKNNILNPVIVARDGVEALDYLFGTGIHAGRDTSRLPAVTLLDLKLPRMDGLEVLRHIRADPRTSLVRVVMLTSSREDQDIVQSYTNGANSYIRKPVDFDEFMTAVGQMGLFWLMLNESPPRAHSQDPMTALPPPHPLRVLFVEDNEDDVMLLSREMRRGGYTLDSIRVDTAEDFLGAIAREPDWDIIISDYCMPRFNGLDALALLSESGNDIPFILVSGTVGEEIAVESMRSGAGDYLLKDNLTRLVPAVQRELRESAERRRRRQAEHDLLESREMLDLIYNSASDMFALLHYPGDLGDFGGERDALYRIVSVNHTLASLIALNGHPRPAESWKGESMRRLAAAVFPGEPLAPSRIVAAFDEAARTRRTQLWEMEQERPGHAFFTEQTAVPVPDPEGNCHFIIWSCRDISARRQAEEKQRTLESQLLQSQKLEALGTLAGGIAHDFNNILTGILGYADLARSLPVLPDLAREGLDQIYHAGHRAADLVRQILTFSRKQATSRRPISLEAVIQEALKLIRPTTPATITLRFRQEADSPPPILADPGQIHQILVNLCTNAIQSMQDNTRGQLSVSLETDLVDPDFALLHTPLKPGPHVVLAISDTGCGMDPSTLSRVFEPFFTTKPPGSGTGLGLAVVHGIVRSHDGAVCVTSEPGRGTSFRLYFPALSRDAIATVPSSNEAPPLGHGQRVILVDDETTVGRIGLEMLSSLGYCATVFNDPEEALESFRHQPEAFDLLITDFTMPKLTGPRLAREIHLLRPALPVILITGLMDPLTLNMLRGLRFQEILLKPFSRRDLADATHKALFLPRPLHEPVVPTAAAD